MELVRVERPAEARPLTTLLPPLGETRFDYVIIISIDSIYPKLPHDTVIRMLPLGFEDFWADRIPRNFFSCEKRAAFGTCPESGPSLAALPFMAARRDWAFRRGREARPGGFGRASRSDWSEEGGSGPSARSQRPTDVCERRYVSEGGDPTPGPPAFQRPHPGVKRKERSVARTKPPGRADRT